MCQFFEITIIYLIQVDDKLILRAIGSLAVSMHHVARLMELCKTTAEHSPPIHFSLFTSLETALVATIPLVEGG